MECDEIMKDTNEMLKAIKDFQNEKVGFNLYDDEKTVEFCIELVYQIFIEKKHKYEYQPDWDESFKDSFVISDYVESM